MPIEYETFYIPDAYRVDLLVEHKFVLEIKCVEHILPVHFKQVITYLKLMNIKNGIVLNFKTNLMEDGIRRVIILERNNLKNHDIIKRKTTKA